MSESVIDALREAAETVPVPLELPDDDDLLEAEEELMLPLPRALRDFLLNVSDVVYGSLEPVTVADPGSHTHITELTARAWEEGLPREYWVLCDGGDFLYCVDHESGEVRVWQRGSSGLDPDTQWADVWAWASNVWLHS